MKRSVAVVLIIVVVVVGTVLWWPKPTPPTDTNTITATTARAQYAAYYQAGWRQDQGRGSMVVTATLLVPPAVTALGLDTGRSSTEEQLWDFVEPLDAMTVPIVVTVDSVAGGVPDATIEKGFRLAAVGGPTFTTGAWKPMIAPTRIVNTNTAASSQVGLMTFTAPQPIDWSKLGTLTLTATGIGDEPTRTFTWSEPRLLLEL